MARCAFLALCVLLSAAVPAGAEPPLLAPEQAFRFSAGLANRAMLEITYRIADGYYLYRERFKFSVDTETIRLGEPQFPAGTWHDDEFFGRSEIYRGSVTIRIPVAPLSGLARFTLVAVSQGCADAGVCFLPLAQKARLIAPGPSPPAKPG